MKPRITIIGIGMGNPRTLTKEAEEAVLRAELLIGAKRLVEGFPKAGASRAAAVKADEILSCIQAHDGLKEIGVLMSGDVGFYSGAKKLVELLGEYDVEILCGISSLQYFCARLKTSWDDAKVVSLHGRDAFLPAIVDTHRKTFVLTGGGHSAAALCGQLCEYGLGNVGVSVGENLSYDTERVVTGTAAQLAAEHFDSLSVMLVENPGAREMSRATHGLPDEAFVRGDVPMTKAEVRAASIAKLSPRAGDVIYDVGAGTGSVSVELALISAQGVVYAVEKNEKALALLRENREKFGVHNLKIIGGSAPDALSDLPAPNRVFIGGSSGNMDRIVELLLQKNPKVRLVVNAITLETVTETLAAFEKFGVSGVEVVQLCVSKSKTVGGYHMMMGQNPVYILSGGGEADA